MADCALQVDDWVPCVQGLHGWVPAFGSAGDSVWSLLITKAYAKQAGSFDALFSLDLLSMASSEVSDPLDQIVSRPCMALAHKLASWPSIADDSGPQCVADEFCEVEQVLKPTEHTAATHMKYWLTCAPGCTVEEHQLSCCIQSERAGTLKLTVQSGTTSDTLLCSKVELPAAGETICVELALQQAYFLDDGPLQLTLDHSDDSTNALSVAFWSKGSSLCVSESPAMSSVYHTQSPAT